MWWLLFLPSVYASCVTNSAWEMIDGAPIPSAQAGQPFAESMAMTPDGTVIVAQCEDCDDVNGDSIGAVYVYQYDGSVWTLMGNPIVAKLNTVGDASGCSGVPGNLDSDCEVNWGSDGVAISDNGDVVAITALRQADMVNERIGAVYVYKYQDPVWVELAPGNAVLRGTQNRHYFGASIDLNADGTVLAVGITRDDGSQGSGDRAGQARVYEYAPNTDSWSELGTAGEMNGEMVDDEFGFSVSLDDSGNRVAVSSVEHPNTGADGHVKVYEGGLMSGAWVQIGTTIAGTPGGGEKAGSAVRLTPDGLRLAVSSSRYDADSNFPDEGKVQVYEWTGLDWTPLGGSIVGTFRLGDSLAISDDGNTLVAASVENDVGSDGQVGIVVVYEYDGSDWVQKGRTFLGEVEMPNVTPDWDELQYGQDVEIHGLGSRIAISSHRGYEIHVLDWESTTVCDTTDTTTSTTSAPLSRGETVSIVIGFTFLACFCCFFMGGRPRMTQEERLNRFVVTGKPTDTRSKAQKILEIVVPKPKKHREDIIKLSI